MQELVYFVLSAYRQQLGCLPVAPLPPSFSTTAALDVSIALGASWNISGLLRKHTKSSPVMDGIHAGLYGRGQQINALIADQSTTDSAHIVNNAHVGLDQQAQKLRDSAVVEAQLHLSTILGEDDGKSSFARQATFSKARHVISGIVKSSQITTCFENGTQSRQYLQSLNTYDAEREGRDDTIPTHPEHNRALVGILVQAFKSTAVAKDKSKYLETFTDKKYDNRLVEARCWQILEFCIERSKRQALLRLWGGDKTKSEGTHVRDMKFADRFDGIVKILSTWKKSCDRVYQAPFIPQLVDNPDWATKQTINNAVSNDRKAVLLDIAKQAEEDVVEQHSSSATTPSPTKRRKTTSTPSSSRRGSVRTPRSGQIVDRAPPPRFPSIPQLSASKSLPSFDDFTPSFHDLDHSTVSSPIKNQQYALPTSPDLFSPPGAQSYFPIDSAAPSHGFNISSLHQRSDADIFNSSNIAFNGETLGSYPTDARTNHLTSIAYIEPLLNLGSWQNDFNTAMPSNNATLTADNAQIRMGGTSYRPLESELNRHEPDPSAHISRTPADVYTITRQEQTVHDNFPTSVQNRYNQQEHEDEHDRSPRHMPRAPLYEQHNSVLLQDGTGMRLSMGPGLGLGNQQTNFSVGNPDLVQSEWDWHDGSNFPDEYWQ